MTKSFRSTAEPSIASPSARLHLGETTTLSGVPFNPTSDHWKYRDGLHNVSLNFRELPGFSRNLQDAAKPSLAWYAANRSPDHLDNLFRRLQHFARWLDSIGKKIDLVTEVDFINYRSSLSPSTQWYVGTLSGLFKKWNHLGYSGVDVALPLSLGLQRRSLGDSWSDF